MLEICLNCPKFGRFSPVASSEVMGDAGVLRLQLGNVLKLSWVLRNCQTAYNSRVGLRILPRVDVMHGRIQFVKRCPTTNPVSHPCNLC